MQFSNTNTARFDLFWDVSKLKTCNLLAKWCCETDFMRIIDSVPPTPVVSTINYSILSHNMLYGNVPMHSLQHWHGRSAVLLFVVAQHEPCELHTALAQLYRIREWQSPTWIYVRMTTFSTWKWHDNVVVRPHGVSVPHVTRRTHVSWMRPICNKVHT